MQEKITDILSKQVDGLLVRGKQVEMEVWERVDAMIDTSRIRPEVPQPLEQPPGEPDNTYFDRSVDSGVAMPAVMPTAQSRSASALLQLQEAIAGIQVRVLAANVKQLCL